MTVPDAEVHHRARAARKQLRELSNTIADAEAPGQDSEAVEQLREAQRIVEDVEVELTGEIVELPPRGGAPDDEVVVEG